VSEAPWREARSAALGRALLVLDEPDVSALGAAMLGAMAAEGGDASSAERLRSGTQRVERVEGSTCFSGYRAASEAIIRFSDAVSS
jgi:sugar (pentulose or hexulose) kinase